MERDARRQEHATEQEFRRQDFLAELEARGRNQEAERVLRARELDLRQLELGIQANQLELLLRGRRYSVLLFNSFTIIFFSF